MRISFDLDEVLFVDPKRYKTEPVPGFVHKRIYRERLRKGTVELINELQKRGYEVWIYTSSYRSENYLKNLFKSYGIKFDGIVNAERHEREVQRGRKQRLPQKMPTHYQISLHIDDEDNIIKNGRAFGYRVFRIYEPDDEWVKKVLNEAERIRKLEESTKKGAANG
jgi:hypothetical protein